MKEYQGEKAIISLTSWKARINTVGKTIFSLIKQCPGFHIVLVLSEEEFPKKEEELPEDLLLLADRYFEILWTYKNTKSFKKVIPTMNKYKDVPIISADDDCFYVCNYAEMLYNAWLCDNLHPYIYTAKRIGTCWTQGPATIYPPIHFKNIINEFNFKDWPRGGDDDYMGQFFKKHNIEIKSLNMPNYPFFFHDEISPLNGSATNKNWRVKQNFGTYC